MNSDRAETELLNDKFVTKLLVLKHANFAKIYRGKA